MKNKKIVYLTAMAVAVVLAGILGLSKVFENGWQDEKTVDNSLDANIDETISESVFNYPYELIGEFTADASKINLQEVANISGETIKFVSGEIEQQKSPGLISELFDGQTGEVNGYRYIFETGEKPDIYTVHVSENGNVTFLLFERLLNLDETEILYDNLTKNDFEIIIENAKQYFDLLGVDYSNDYEDFEIQLADNPWYAVKDKRTFASIYMLKTSTGDFELLQFTYRA